MGKRNIVFFLSLGAVVAGLLHYVLTCQEPKYNGKRISAWIKEGGKAELAKIERQTTVYPYRPVFDEDDPAQEAIRTIGTNALPYLAEALNRKDSFVAQRYRSVWQKLPGFMRALLPQFISPRTQKRAAARMLRDLVFNHPPAAAFDSIVPALIKTVQEKEDFLGILTLGQIAGKHESKTALAALIRMLDSPRMDDRSLAAKMLAESGKLAGRPLPSLIKLMNDPTPAVRANAAFAVYRTGIQTNEAVRLLTESLKDPTASGNAAHYLSLIGPPATAAVPALIKAAHETNQYVRGWALTALKKIQPAAYEAAKPSLPELIAELQHPATCHGAADQLQAMGPEAREAGPALLEALRRENEDSFFLARALLAIDPQQGPAIVPEMIKYLRDRNAVNRHGAADVLAKIGPGAEAAIPVLTAGLTERKPLVRQRCADALFKIGLRNEATKRLALQVLMDGLRVKHEVAYRRFAAQYLGEIGPQAKEAASSLLEVSQEEDEELRKSAKEALKKIDPDAAAKAGVE
ncbi:MAG: HEAT repeat domain-containing protein [Chloroflexi bacterium]|nr:HEAT repeat domain-containing protein [Chloroflexota bacterium]